MIVCGGSFSINWIIKVHALLISGLVSSEYETSNLKNEKKNMLLMLHNITDLIIIKILLKMKSKTMKMPYILQNWH